MDRPRSRTRVFQVGQDRASGRLHESGSARSKPMLEQRHASKLDDCDSTLAENRAEGLEHCSGVSPCRNRISGRRYEAPEEIAGGYASAVRCEDILSRRHFRFAMLTAPMWPERLFLPMIFAVMLNLLMQPTLRALERLRVPRALGAVLLILVLFATIVGLGTAVSGPAEAWIAKLPEGIPRIEERLRFLNAPINTLRTFLAAANNFGAAGTQRSSPGPLDGGAILSSVFAGTRSFAGGLFTTVMFLYFLLVSGDSFLRRFVEVLPRFSSKRQAVDISQQIERDISAYLLTITIMNALVGAATGLVMWGPASAILFYGERSHSF